MHPQNLICYKSICLYLADGSSQAGAVLFILCRQSRTHILGRIAGKVFLFSNYGDFLKKHSLYCLDIACSSESRASLRWAFTGSGT